MPVVATVERGKQLARRPDVRITRERVRNLVGIFLVHAFERERSESPRRRGVDRRTGAAECAGRRS